MTYQDFYVTALIVIWLVTVWHYERKLTQYERNDEAKVIDLTSRRARAKAAEVMATETVINSRLEQLLDDVVPVHHPRLVTVQPDTRDRVFDVERDGFTDTEERRPDGRPIDRW